MGFAFPAQANDTRQVLYVGCQTHTASQPGLVRPYGDSNGWTFEVQLVEGASWVKDSQHWSHSGGSGENADPTWGQWTNGEVGDSTISWSQPDHTGAFHVTFTGQITCGAGGGGGPITVTADWSGNVKNKHWDPGTAIGKDLQPDGTTTENGRIISPQDWRVDPPNPPVVTVEPGETVNLQVEDATDIDHWTKGNEECTDQQCYDPDEVNYTWDAGGNGVLTPTDGKGQTVTWKAPDTGGTYPIHCTIDDLPKPIDTANGEEPTRDDAPLIRQMQIKVAKYTITFDDPNPKACAGHVNDSVHEFTSTATVTREGVAVPNHAVTLFFEGNNSNGEKASFVTGSENTGDDPAQQIHLTTDANGKVSFTVLSSDLITSSIRIKAKSTTADGHEITLDGEETCNFEQATSKRNFTPDPTSFPNISFPNDDDNGWLFNADVLINGGDQTTAKIYLKYKKEDGSEVPVNGHKMKITIGEITAKDSYTISGDKSRYIYFVDKDGNELKDEHGNPVTEVDPVTQTTKDANGNDSTDKKEQGFAICYLKGGPFIYQANQITLEAEDQTQVK